MKKEFLTQHKLMLHPKANPDMIICGASYRFTILTPQLIRAEYSKNGQFNDQATQTVIDRAFPVVRFQVFETAASLQIVTENVRIDYQKETPFAQNTLSMQVTGNLSAYHSIWHYGDPVSGLGGTARTLDEVDGACPLENGLMSRSGFGVLDDSRTLLLREDGWVDPRPSGCVDLYFFGYGRAYLNCLRDYYHLTGSTPLLPKYALGNWWSRFHKYTETSYKELIGRFQEEEIPFSVAVIDMDWHLVDIPEKYGSGWTGYTWNKELFPDPPAFMGWLHEQGMKITLNVHPAEGVRPHEEAYKTMAEALGKDMEKEEWIPFDITDPEFLEAYFKYIHHPNEKDGVDFWWVDWQSGSVSKLAGMDPLWMLNHFHYLDSMRNGKRGLTFSRYAGPGSHRYPIGFSGDSIVTWESLQFQPYFTATASNIGYGWWSHDIGGHMRGVKDDELATRWLQFGVFSPINRLHSSGCIFNGKEPWRYNKISEEIMKDFLRTRHLLIPYLHSMNYRSALDNQPLIQPLYYQHPWTDEAYEVPNEYYFGSEMLVCPITEPLDEKTRYAGVSAWLPEGTWFDFFTGKPYQGGRKIRLYRGLESLPVLVKAGGILPLQTWDSDINKNPEALRFMIYCGADGNFDLIEDDGEQQITNENDYARTQIQMNWMGDSAAIKISSSSGNLSVLPASRNYTLSLNQLESASIQVLKNGIAQDVLIETKGNSSSLILKDVKPTDAYVINLSSCKLSVYDFKDQLYRFLNQAQLEFKTKETIFELVEERGNDISVLSELQCLNLDPVLLEIISEILWA